MANIPHDIFANILALLPLESLQRFKCVSKLWRSTIENQEKLLLLTPEISYSPFSFVDGGKLEEITSPLNPIMLPTKFHKSLPIHISSCHGLVFMALKDGSMILWNPSSRKYDEIPLVDENSSSSSTHPPIYCFGYDPFSTDYKIVRLKTAIGTYSLEMMHEFSQKKRCWRMMNRDILSSKYKLLHNNAVVYDGAFHFLATTSNRCGRDFVILSYSLKDEIFYEISIPDQKFHVHCLCLYRHRLSWWSSGLIGRFGTNLEVWSLFGDNWEEVSSIRNPIGDKFCVAKGIFVRNGGDFLVVNVEDAEPIVYRYDPSWNEFRKSDYYFPKFAKGVEYVASSVSPTYP